VRVFFRFPPLFAGFCGSKASSFSGSVMVEWKLAFRKIHLTMKTAASQVTMLQEKPHNSSASGAFAWHAGVA